MLKIATEARARDQEGCVERSGSSESGQTMLAAGQRLPINDDGPFREALMVRALFLAIGIFVVVLGAQCLVVDRFVLAGEARPEPAAAYAFQPQLEKSKEVIPAEWAPWTLLSTGAVMVLYSLTLNRGGP